MGIFKHDIEPEDLKLPKFDEPLYFGGLTVKPDRIFYKKGFFSEKKMFSFQDIDQVGWSYTKMKKHGVGVVHRMKLKIWVRSLSEPVDVSISKWYGVYRTFRSVKEKHIQLMSIYVYIMSVRSDLSPRKI